MKFCYFVGNGIFTSKYKPCQWVDCAPWSSAIGNKRDLHAHCWQVKPFIATLRYNIQDVSKPLRQTSWTSSPQQGKNFIPIYVRRKMFMSIYDCKPLFFLGKAPKFAWLQSFTFLSVEIIRTPSVFSSTLKRREISPVHFCCASNNTQPHWDLWRSATVHDQTCPGMLWFTWRIFWAFVANCDVTNNKNSSVIKLGRCTVNVLRQLYLKYYTVKVFIVECNISIKRKNHWFPDICLRDLFFFVLVWRTYSWSSSKHFRHILCMSNFGSTYVPVSQRTTLTNTEPDSHTKMGLTHSKNLLRHGAAKQQQRRYYFKIITKFPTNNLKLNCVFVYRGYSS